MKYLLILTFLVPVLQSRAQLPNYYVYLVHGYATITKPGTKPLPVKQHQLVFKNNILVLKKDAEITLVDRDANFLILNKAGTYKGDKLTENAAKKNNNGITAKYLTLLFHELLDPNEDFEKFKSENIAGVWGGVSRGHDCGNRIFPVNGLKSSTGSIIFRWHKTSPSSRYSLVIYKDEHDSTVIAVKDTLMSVNINETLHPRPGKYYWTVTSNDGACEDRVPVLFEILTPDDEQKLTGQPVINEDGKSVETQLLQIDKLDENGFIYAAMARYRNLVKANPENTSLRKSYVLFLLKYGFDEDAASAWK
jgi:hypothetical protein